MDVGFYDLCNGRILNINDTLLIHGVSYIVDKNESRANAFYLKNQNFDDCHRNNEVFVKLGMSDYEVKKWAENFNSTGNGIFPEFECASDLTKFVIDIYKKSRYNVGDSVRIISREGDGDDYPFYYADEMSAMAGQVFQIKRIEIADYSDVDTEKYHGDPHKYFLNESQSWQWHSSMFTKDVSVQSTIEQPCPKKSDKSEISITLKHTTKTIIKL